MKRNPITLLQGRATILNRDGSVAYQEPGWSDNFLADQGEESVLNVYFREQANVAKYLALLTATPAETATPATMTELSGAGGYARIQIAAGDWGAPALDSGDHMTTAAAKTFGPATGAAWTAVTYAALVSSASGTTGIFVLAVPLAGSTVVNVGQSFQYTLRAKAQ